VSDLVVTVDGPSGTGKTTVSKEVARLAGLPHLDTGAYYRAATLVALRSGVDLADAEEVERVTAAADLGQEHGIMYLDGEDVSSEIRSDGVTAGVSEVSAHPGVRRILVARQRAWVTSHENRAVVEGRDIGSVVFPDATLKVYLDASAEVRALRRALQDGVDPEQVIADQARRDHLDSTRETSPLSVPDGAVVVDTSHLSLDEVVEQILNLVEASSERSSHS
jgi:cytidylate kinase